jgi:hypothetical protein
MDLKDLGIGAGSIGGLVSIWYYVKSKLSGVRYQDTCIAMHKGVDRQLEDIKKQADTHANTQRDDMKEIKADIKEILKNSNRRRNGEFGGAGR